MTIQANPPGGEGPKPRRLTRTQLAWLEWVGSCFDGVQDITDTRMAMPMLKRGLVSYDTFQDCWSITEAGRAAILRATARTKE